MTRWTLNTFAILLLSVAALQAQDLTGTWQGTPNVGGRNLRTVIKIAKGANGALTGTFYSIDQNPQGIGLGPITMQNGTVKFTIPAMGGSFEGKLDTDNATLSGTFTQGPASFPLNLTKATPETAWAIPEPPPPPVRMDPKANPAFEVATIKPSNPNTPGKLFTVRGVNVMTINTTLSDIMTMAYNLHAKQIENAPEWAGADKYDVTGKPDVPGLPSTEQMKSMLQKMMTDRFKLKFHKEKKELSAYVITVAKGGPKLTPSQADPNSLPGLFFNGPGRFNVRNATLAEVAQVLQGAVMDRPVVDQTGLTGKYDFTLNWTPDEFQFSGLRGPGAPPLPPPPPGQAEMPDLYTAIQQQLGLKLESTKAPVEVLVIDHVEKPSEN
jgi:uncharacterized protein (TIGR03435 family)